MNRIKLLVLAVSASGLLAGFVAPWLGRGDWQSLLWGASSGIVLLFLTGEIVTSLRRGELGLDIVAGLSMSVAIVFGETLAAAVVSLMYAGGQMLEEFAASRARTEMRALLARAPKTALRYRDGDLESCGIELLRPGDRVLIRQGDVVPADGIVESGTALLDLAVLTGESVPVKRVKGEEVQSGSASLDMAFDMKVARTAADSAYSAIVNLVKAAQEAKAPMARLADRYAVAFLALTLAIAAGAFAISGEKMRLLAVLVVATPCPLILAVPVAIISGLSRAAGRGVLIKGGPVLERLAKAVTLVVDKTGTLTHGHAELIGVEAGGRRRQDDVLRIAASLDQASSHVIAASIVSAARTKGLELSQPTRVRETAGEGIAGMVGGRHVVVGGQAFVRHKLGLKHLKKPEAPPGSVLVAVAIGGKLAGHLILADSIRPDAKRALAKLKRAGIERVILASGDASAVVGRIAAELGIADARGELSPQDKVAIVMAERARGTVIMAGDGVNDAPALAAADIGMAMGVRGSAASAEAADAVILADNLDRIAEAIRIAKRSFGIARQSVAAGLGLSVAAMIVAAFGYLPPVQGALLQEVIDVAVILNALRALR